VVLNIRQMAYTFRFITMLQLHVSSRLVFPFLPPLEGINEIPFARTYKQSFATFSVENPRKKQQQKSLFHERNFFAFLELAKGGVRKSKENATC
jgi:hypothetical protein